MMSAETANMKPNMIERFLLEISKLLCSFEEVATVGTYLGARYQYILRMYNKWDNQVFETGWELLHNFAEKAGNPNWEETLPQFMAAFKEIGKDTQLLVQWNRFFNFNTA